ncbi:MAG: DUF5057 domain-containing protein [Lachnospiraceae bacterium]|nr:DUF5057 domain-containing protein [Lachnospiraceae bacterium]
MEKNKKRYIRIIAIVVTVAIVSVSFLLYSTTVAAARSTFSGVEEIIYNNREDNAFHIVEVVPDKGMGSIGYYVSGNEPMHEVLGMLGSAKDRYTYVQNLKTLLTTKQLLGSVSSTNCPLAMADYEELYEGSISDNELQTLLSSGEWKEFHRRETISQNDVVSKISANTIPENTVSINSLSTNSVLDYKMEVAFDKDGQPLGDYLPYFEPASKDEQGNPITNPAWDYFFYNNNQCFSASANNAGIFDPHLIENGDKDGKHYQAVFREVKGTVGYLPKDVKSVQVGGDWDPDYMIGTPLYQQEDGVYVAKGTLSYNEADGKVEIKALNPKEVSLCTPLDGVSIASEEKENKEIEKDVTTSLDGEESVGDANTYQMMMFTYDESRKDAPHYQVDSLVNDKEKKAPYFIDFEKPLVPNGAGTGLINPNFDKLDFMTVVYHYEQGNGLYKLTKEEGKETAVSGSRIFYKGGFTNNEWFKQFVFEREYNTQNQLENVYLDVTTITAAQLENYDLSKIDLLYLSNSKGEFLPNPYSYHPYGDVDSKNDLSNLKAMELLRMVVEEKLPVIVDASLLEEKQSVISKLATILDQKDPSIFYADNSGKSEIELSSVTVSGNFFVDSDTHFVNESVYFFKDNTTNGTQLFNNAFDVNYSESVIKDGFQEVLDEIKIENSFIQEENRVSGTNKATIEEAVSQAVAIQYILSEIARRGILGKDEIRVLEIQPVNIYPITTDCDVQQKRDANNNALNDLVISGQKVIEDSTKPIIVTTMSTSEFIGKTEDINSKYDLIYIGLNIGTTSDAYMNTKNGRTVYNDSTMNGLVYTAVGDQVYTSDMLKGLPINDKSNLCRYSGNDITEEKTNDLKEYLQAGYPVIFAQNFYNSTSSGISVYTKTSDTTISGYIDNSSNMYQLANFALTYIKEGRNAMRFESGSGVNHDILKFYLDLAKPDIDFDSEKSGVITDDAGNQYVSYYFQVNNKGITNKKSTFHMNLYIDVNADGRFSEKTEKVSDNTITIKDSAGNVADIDSLSAGVKYHLTRPISSGYRGVITWKLEASDHDKNMRRDSQSGYYKVMSPEKIKINALQINTTPHRNYNTTWNMEESLKDPNSLLRKYAKDDLDIKNYDISIKTIRSDDFSSLYDAGQINIYDYDMLIMGFADYYEAPKSTAAMDEIKKYIQSGRSVLFTHDTTSFYNDYSDSEVWGVLFNKKIREVVGLDRYGASGDTSFVKEKAFKPNSGRGIEVKQTQGYSNQILENKWKQSNYTNNYTYYRNLNYYKNSLSFTSIDLRDSNSICQINSGQITDYPYKISTESSPYINNIATTHAQYYQLDLAGDFDKDNENDIVVWYTINSPQGKNTFYKYSLNDVRNNYYIYNRGNVTYSGAGHSNMENNNDNEVKLFVNTLVSSYYAGVKAPKVSIVENSNITSNTIENIYAPFDAGLANADELQNYVDTTETVYFHASDVNLIKESSVLSAKVYYENEAATPVTINGEALKVTELDLSAYPIKDAKTGEVMSTNGTAANSRVIQDNVVYAVEIPSSILGNKNSRKIHVVVSDNVKLNSNADFKEISGNDELVLSKLQLFDLK